MLMSIRHCFLLPAQQEMTHTFLIFFSTSLWYLLFPRSFFFCFYSLLLFHPLQYLLFCVPYVVAFFCSCVLPNRLISSSQCPHLILLLSHFFVLPATHPPFPWVYQRPDWHTGLSLIWLHFLCLLSVFPLSSSLSSVLSLFVLHG